MKLYASRLCPSGQVVWASLTKVIPVGSKDGKVTFRKDVEEALLRITDPAYQPAVGDPFDMDCKTAKIVQYVNPINGISYPWWDAAD